MLKKLRLILLPFSWIYGLVASLRRKFIKPTMFEIPMICIGNLRVGGTGKTPHTEYIAKLLADSYKVAVLSRGYRRQTQGFVLAESQNGNLPTAKTIGDEPLQYFHHLPNVKVAVDENRCEGVEKLTSLFPDLNAILLDDAYQHLHIKAQHNILLTCYDDLYVHDYPLPAGNLREPRSAAKNADIILVTKTPSTFCATERHQVIDDLKVHYGQQVFFSTYEYLPLQPFNSLASSVVPKKNHTILLLTGIASPKSLYDHLSHQFLQIIPMQYSDHHEFTQKDFEKIQHLYAQRGGSSSCVIVTTEKDSMRLRAPELENVVSLLPIFVAPIQVRVLFNQENEFNNLILSYVR